MTIEASVRWSSGRFLRLVLPLVLLLGLSVPSFAQEPIPDLIDRKIVNVTEPLWVSAEAATGDDGQLVWDYFSSGDREVLKPLIERIDAGTVEEKVLVARQKLAQEDGSPYLPQRLCPTLDVWIDEPDWEEARPRDSFVDLVQHARAIYKGEVTALEQGFLGAVPHTLMKVEVQDVLRSSEDFAASNHLYVAYPYAAFAIGSRVFCTDDPGYGYYRPQLGDKLLIFPNYGPLDEGEILIKPEPGEILAEKASGSMALPSTLGEEFAGKDLQAIQEAAEGKDRRLPESRDLFDKEGQ